jgi:hypothetical protein
MAGSGRSYRLVYSETARAQLRELIAKARDLGLSLELLVAMRMVEQRLQLDPLVFGEPRNDLPAAGLQARAGGHDLLYAEYLVALAHPLVFIRSLQASPGRGF